MTRIKCFMLERITRVRISLRRYVSNSKCSGPMSYHNASNFLEEREGKWIQREGVSHLILDVADLVDNDHFLWPTQCPCGYTFAENDIRQIFQETLYKRADTGEILTLREAPAGAMYNAEWISKKGPDGICLAVLVPGLANGEPYNHTWHIDGRASNCDMPSDTEHFCWVRHGVAPEITVDKNGKTCGAGGGSIGVPGGHGFLRNGHLEMD